MKFRDTCSNKEVDSDDLPIQVCSSAAGYYIGQLEPCGAPYSRLSGYFRTHELADDALKNGWTDRGADENKEVVEGLKKKGVLHEQKRQTTA